MKKPVKEFSEEEMVAAFGDLSAEERAEMQSGPGGEMELDPKIEAHVRSGLTGLGTVISEAEASVVPAMPSSVKVAMMKQVADSISEKEAEEKAFEARNLDEKNRPEPREASTSIWSKLLQPGPIFGLAGVAAAIAVGLFILGQPGGSSVTRATTASVLTPGEVTAFRAPVFTWKTDNGGVVDLEVVDPASGKVVAKAERVFSPIAFEKLDPIASLKAGGEYRFRILKEKQSLAEVTFATTPDASETGPVRDATLEGVIGQCENHIAAGRPADAWMLWSKLTDGEKSDSRMQELKARILEMIG